MKNLLAFSVLWQLVIFTKTINSQFRTSTAISLFISEVCDAMYDSLKRDYLRVPATAEEWEELAKLIYQHWQFPNCKGAMDGKHLAMFAPQNSYLTFFNYKSFHSIILFGLVKHSYQFTHLDIGCQGRISLVTGEY